MGQNLFGTSEKMQKYFHAGALVTLHCVLSPDFIFPYMFWKRSASGKLHLWYKGFFRDEKAPV